eukprot:5974094-Heterocapsa_arctica.AAC.1
MSIYGLDVGQTNHTYGNNVLRGRVGIHLSAIGRVPLVVGGDWNLPTGAFTIEGASSIAAYVEPGAPTCITGSTIYWFMASS